MKNTYSHPIYNDTIYAKAFDGYKRSPTKFNQQVNSMGSQAIGLKIHMQVMDAISKSGHVLVDIENDEWRSDITKKTLSTLKPSDINFPFRAGAVVDKEVDSGIVFFNITKDHLDVSFEVEDKESGTKGILSQRIDANSTFEEGMRSFSSHKDEVYMIVSVLMYIGMFKREKLRVSERVSNKLKSSKKRSIPSHSIHTILVRQPMRVGSGGYSGDREQGDRKWLVRGHMRNQWYSKEEVHKPKWIDAYWKGEGKEEVEKIYKV